MSAWQPIETAPKKTRLLVALIRDGEVMRVSDAIRHDHGFYTVYGGQQCHWRTHWMPLPVGGGTQPSGGHADGTRRSEAP